MLLLQPPTDQAVPAVPSSRDTIAPCSALAPLGPGPAQAITRTRHTMENPERPMPPIIIDVAVERQRIAALEKLRQRLESALDETPSGYGYAAMAGQLRDTVNAIADARNRIYEALLDEEPGAGDQ
jgi:hypothetical protein